MPPLDADRDTTNAIRRQCEGLTLNPTKPQLEETLPEGFTRNYAGFLIKSARKRIHVSKEIVATEEEFLEDYIVVASFLGGKLTPLAFAAWLANLYSHLGSGLVVASDNTRRGFFCLKASSKEVARQLLALTPYKSEEIMCIFQMWSLDFDPSTRKDTSLGWDTELEIAFKH
uniref:Uncharacterized protein n=1 Tax=Physcomitrium patens TaxID=3218 RepID=A0A2K1JPM6_PHYPA|nr:hypothetical protein PHYPA_015875 [Physcomitrium patens]